MVVPCALYLAHGACNYLFLSTKLLIFVNVFLFFFPEEAAVVKGYRLSEIPGRVSHEMFE